MVVGIGTDIIRTARIKRLLDRYPAFAGKIFSPGEIAYCSAKASPELSYAVRFAAKEAVMKALGTGWGQGVNFPDIEVATDAAGRPEIILRRGAKDMMQRVGATHVHVSLSHEKEYALAFVVLEQQKA
jgi:holo-[acyl-carrier protein] synthase